MRGQLTAQRDLSELTWLRVGGPADYLFRPEDIDDLSDFLRALSPDAACVPDGGWQQFDCAGMVVCVRL